MNSLSFCLSVKVLISLWNLSSSSLTISSDFYNLLLSHPVKFSFQILFFSVLECPCVCICVVFCFVYISLIRFLHIIYFLSKNVYVIAAFRSLSSISNIWVILRFVCIDTFLSTWVAFPPFFFSSFLPSSFSLSLFLPFFLPTYLPC